VYTVKRQKMGTRFSRLTLEPITLPAKNADAFSKRASTQGALRNRHVVSIAVPMPQHSHVQTLALKSLLCSLPL